MLERARRRGPGDLRRRGRAGADPGADAHPAAAAHPDADLPEQDRPRWRGPGRVLRAIADVADPGDRADGRGRRRGHPRCPGRPVRGRIARARGLAEVLAEHDDALLAAYVDGTLPDGAAARRAGGADRAGAGAPGVPGLGHHRRGRRRADRRHRDAAAGHRGRPARAGVRHGVQSGAWAGGGEDRLRADVRRHRAAARRRAVRRRRARQGDRGRRLRQRRPPWRRKAVTAGQIGKLWGLRDIRIGDAIGVPRRGTEHHFAPPTLETVVVPARPAGQGRAAPRARRRSPSRTR